MGTQKKKLFFTNHSKSSAIVISLVVHAILAVVAISFVAVTVITKGEQNFEAKQVTRPRMPQKQLQVPVKIQKKQRKPKLRQRIVVKQKVNRNMPDIKMPEISGIKGGFGAAGGAGLGMGAGVGFSMPEIEIFGIRSKGEKIFIALDADGLMVADEIGGMRAYTVIKDEVNKIIKSLGPTTLFNLAIFQQSKTVLMFPNMVPATHENVAKVEAWIKSLNDVKEGMKKKDYGIRTLGKGGVSVSDKFTVGNIRKPGGGASGKLIASQLSWYIPAAVAMQEQADTVFILTGWWGTKRYTLKPQPVWSENNRQRWDETIRKANELLAKENEARVSRGDPIKVIQDNHFLVREYFRSLYPTIRRPEPPWISYTPRDFADALKIVRKENASKTATKSGLSKKKKDHFSVNVIFFARQNDEGRQDRQMELFSAFAKRLNGKFRSIAGLKEIQDSISK